MTQSERRRARFERRRATLGRHLREARRRAGLTLREVANEVGVTHVTVHGYENGVYEPPGLRLLDLWRVLDVDLSRLPVSLRR